MEISAVDVAKAVSEAVAVALSAVDRLGVADDELDERVLLLAEDEPHIDGVARGVEDAATDVDCAGLLVCLNDALAESVVCTVVDAVTVTLLEATLDAVGEGNLVRLTDAEELAVVDTEGDDLVVAVVDEVGVGSMPVAVAQADGVFVDSAETVDVTENAADAEKDALVDVVRDGGPV